jgi:chitin disaccharide deacetylase
MNADDFGLTGGVNQAILELHKAGVLTSTTLMAKATATSQAIALSHATPSLGVGCHVVLVDGDPVLEPSSIPTLADAQTGRLHPTLGAFLKRLLTDRISSDDIEAEAAAQISQLQSQGVRLTHIDTHKHTHMFPAILRPVLRAARAAGIHTVRNPFEPEWSLRATLGAPWVRRTQVRMLRAFEPAFRRIVEEEGFNTTDGALGVLATGTLDPATVASLLGELPTGCFELVAHPGYNDADLARAHTRLLTAREIEQAALLVVRSFPAIELVSFAALAQTADSAIV